MRAEVGSEDVKGGANLRPFFVGGGGGSGDIEGRRGR